MSNEAKAWAHAAAWALIALLRSLQVGSGLGVFFAVLGVGFAVSFACLTWNDHREGHGRER